MSCTLTTHIQHTAFHHRSCAIDLNLYYATRVLLVSWLGVSCVQRAMARSMLYAMDRWPESGTHFAYVPLTVATKCRSRRSLIEIYIYKQTSNFQICDYYSINDLADIRAIMHQAWRRGPIYSGRNWFFFRGIEESRELKSTRQKTQLRRDID